MGPIGEKVSKYHVSDSYLLEYIKYSSFIPRVCVGSFGTSSYSLRIKHASGPYDNLLLLPVGVNVSANGRLSPL